MPSVLLKFEHKGSNSGRTVILNMDEIAKCLSFPPQYILKHMSYTLGAQTQMDCSLRFAINGQHTNSRVQKCIDDFLENFVVCKLCHLPETDMSVNSKKKTIRLNCRACGHSAPVDTKHKMVKYILAHPPKSFKKKVKCRRKSSRGTKTKSKPDNSEDEADELPATFSGMSINEIEPMKKDNYEKFQDYVKEQLPITTKTCFQDIRKNAEQLDVVTEAPYALCKLLLQENIVDKIEFFKDLFKLFTQRNVQAQLNLLRGLELKAHDVQGDIILADLGHVCFLLNLHFVVEKEAFKKWNEILSHTSQPTVTMIKDKIQPFIAWLDQ